MKALYYGKSIWRDKPELVTELTVCIDKKWSSSQSSEHLSAMAGQRITRNCVMGKASRMGLKFQSVSAPKRDTKNRQPVVNFQRTIFRINSPSTPPTMPAEPVKPPEFLGLTFAELPDKGCRFIDGDPAGVHSYCGQPSIAGKSSHAFCSYHYQICYRKPMFECRLSFGP